jgi:hypothetical protein
MNILATEVKSGDFYKYFDDNFKINSIKNEFHKLGVVKLFHKANKDKKLFILNIDVNKKIKIEDRPDIIFVNENKGIRKSNCFIKIIKTNNKLPWIGLTEEQFSTIKRSAKGRQIYMVYASLRSDTINNNPKTADLTGMFFKEIENQEKSTIFQKFADLNVECRIEFILTSQDLENFSFPFERGMNMYETNLFNEKKSSSFYSANGSRKDVLDIQEFKGVDKVIDIDIEKDIKAERLDLSKFHINGSFKLITKKKKTYIECITDVILFNNIFGEFTLKQGKFYSFNLATVGRDPKLKRNNVFIAKRRVYQLINENKIRKPDDIVKEIVELI